MTRGVLVTERSSSHLVWETRAATDGILMIVVRGSGVLCQLRWYEDTLSRNQLSFGVHLKARGMC